MEVATQLILNCAAISVDELCFSRKLNRNSSEEILDAILNASYFCVVVPVCVEINSSSHGTYTVSSANTYVQTNISS